MIGYKVFEPGLVCRGYQFELGKTHVHDGKVVMCKSGFHFCEKLIDCFNYYSFNIDNIVCEIEADDVLPLPIDELYDKRVCGKITLIRQLSWYEVLDLCNSGKNNTGYKNSGNQNSGNFNSGSRNSGHYNSGDFNSGNHNSGHWNSGNFNSGSRNSGNQNSGRYNSGNQNSGHYNSGHYNSGHYNSGNHNSGNRNNGIFNSFDSPIYMFNKIANITQQEYENIIYNLENIFSSYSLNYKLDWEKINDQQKQFILNLPNFCPIVFKEITGIEC